MTSDEKQNPNVIRIRGARVHNLKSIDVDIPRDSLVVVTGLSGSGKSSLVFDTLFAEGQRRYLESLSTYTRNYLNQLERPDADSIEGLPPTISVDQRIGSVRPRSTLATTTEIYDYLRLLYARAGQAHCPGCQRPVSRQTAQAIVAQILSLAGEPKAMILAPLVRGRKGMHRKVFERICHEGFVRARVDGDVVDAANPPELAKSRAHNIEAVVDRIVIKAGIRTRLQESVELALKLGEGSCLISWQAENEWRDRLFSEKFACPDCGLSFPQLEPRSFSFNSPYGACRTCDGLGVLYEKNRGDAETDVDLENLPPCSACSGSRLNPFSSAVTFAETPMQQFVAMTVAESLAFVEQLQNSATESEKQSAFPAEANTVTERIFIEIIPRLRYLDRVGLGYLTLDRPTRTLSGGEYQRSRLAGCLGSGLNGVCYLLDEPTIGLHSYDTSRLIDALIDLRDQGSSVIVVEHDLPLIRQSDWLIDLGPGAGKAGGRLVAAGRPETVANHKHSPTAKYLNGRNQTVSSRPRRSVESHNRLTLTGATTHNLKDVTVTIPLGVMTCVTGVSGSGKSSLIADTLIPAVRHALDVSRTPHGHYETLEGAEQIDRIVEIDQKPIGRSGRSNPATYSGIWDEIRRVFSHTREARLRGYKPRRFSFNSREGRCETCKGQGTHRIEMHFMPDMFVSCPDCGGSRFNRQTTAVRFLGHSVADVLDMRIDEAVDLFANVPKLQSILTTFDEVGLGYLCLGQSSRTLSGGESQRVKLATELSRTGPGKTLFVLDEPTTGLHPADIQRLLVLLNRLVDQGNSVLVVEHQLDVVVCADWVIDLGPGGGDAGGTIVAQGLPSRIAEATNSLTGHALKEHFTITGDAKC